MSTEVQRLAALVAQLQGDVATLSRERRLSHASLEGGGINVYQPGTQGRPGVKLGEQYDGSYAPVPLGGPNPPMPAAPSAQGGVERLTVRWDGTFASGPLTVAPQDWSRVEVHASTDPTPGILFETLRGSIESPRGGELSVMGLAPDTDYYVWLVSRSQAGKFSDPSQVVGPVRVEKLAVPEIDLSEIGGNTIYRGPDVPVPPEAGHKVGDLWLQTPDNIAHRWEGDPGSWVQSADQRIATALDEAFTANQAAEQAGIDALAARDTAGTAQTTATDAVNTANSAAQQAATAIQNASNAAALADSKVAAYYSSTPPTGLVAGDVGDLWFDTANGNRVKRWSGTAWTDISDVRVATALTDAANAQTAAGNAQNTANTKVVTFYQTEPPATTGRTTGDLWVDTNDGNKLYRWSGTAWVAVPFGAGAISATARQLGAITTYKQAAAPTSGMIVGDFWIRSSDNRVHRWNGTTWEESKDAEINTAVTNAATAQATADGKVRIFAQADAPTGMTAGDVGDLWIETDAGNKMWTWSGSAWVARPLGNAAIEPKSLVARDVIATGTVSAALLESVMVLATTIIAGDTAGIHSRLTGTGLRVFNADGGDAGTEPDEVARFGTDTGDVFAIVRDGRLAGAVDRNANFTGALGSFQDLTIGAADFTGRGGSLNEMLDRRPRMLAGWGSDTSNYSTNTVAGRGVFDITARLFFGRMYMINVLCRVNGEVANDALAEVQVRWTESQVGTLGSYIPPAPAAPTINSPVAARIQASTARPEAQGVVLRKPFSLGYGAADTFRDMRFLLCLARPVGGTTVTMFGSGGNGDIIEMWIEDVGPFIQPTKTLNNGGGTATNPGPVVAAQTQRYTLTWRANWHQNWAGDGSFLNVPDAWQGLNGTAGNTRSYLGFSGTDLEGTGQTMDQALSGAVIESASAYLYANYWFVNTGGWAVVGFHGFRNPASAFGAGDEWMIGDEFFTKPGAHWFNLGRDGIDLQRFTTGVWKGIMLGAAAAGTLENSAHFNTETADPSTMPHIQFTFRK